MRSKMTITLVWLAITCNAFGDVDESDARSGYGGPSTPNGMAFRGFIGIAVESGPQENYSGGYFLTDAYQLEHTDANRNAADKVFKVLQKAHENINKEIRAEEKKQLCGKARTLRLQEESYAVLDAIEDQRRVIEDRNYVITMKRIGAIDPLFEIKTQQAIDQVKTGFYSVSTDHKAMYEESGADVNIFIGGLCERFEREDKNEQ